MAMFQARDGALQTVLQYCQTYRPACRTLRCRDDGAWQQAERPVGAAEAAGGTQVSVLKEDVLDVALRRRAAGADPLVLILADDERPGGCVHAGAGMQEESLFRRTALFAHLRADLYPIRCGEALYARGVPVLLASEREGYAPLPAPHPRLSFIACPGIKMPRLVDGRLSDEDAALLRGKVRVILRTAVAHGHDEVVLGALGCGVWGCPPHHVASVFKEVIEREGAARGAVRAAHFAITGSTFNVFRDVFSS